MAGTLDIGMAQGQGTGNPVGIPNIEPQTQAALAPSPKQLTVPDRIPITNPGMFADIKDATNKLGDIFAAQAANRYHLQIAGQVDSFMQLSAQIKADAMQNGTSIPNDPNSMVGLYQAQSNKLIQQIQGDPSNSTIVNALQMHMGLIQAHNLEELTLAMPKAAAAEQDAQLKSLVSSGATTVANSYVVNPNPKGPALIDDPMGQAATTRNQVQQLVSSLQAHKPQQAQATLDAFNKQVAFQRMQAWATKDPSSAMAEFIKPDFLNRNPDITSEQWQTLRSGAVTQSDYAQHQIDAALTSQASDLEKTILQKQANGQPVGADLETLGAHFGGVGGVGEFYRNHTGHDYVQNLPSVGGVSASLKNEIEASTRSTIGGVQVAIDQAVANRTLNPKDAATLQLEARQRAVNLKDDHFSDTSNGWAGLNDRYLMPKTAMDKVQTMMDPTINSATLKSHWVAALARNKGDVPKSISEVQKEMDAITGKSGAAAGAVGRLLK